MPGCFAKVVRADLDQPCEEPGDGADDSPILVIGVAGGVGRAAAAARALRTAVIHKSNHQLM